MTSKQCARGETCEIVDNCPQIEAKYEEYNATKSETILNELKSSVCNKGRKGFCCPVPSVSVDISPRTTCEAPAPPSSASPVSTMKVERCGGATRLVTQIFGGQEAKGEFPFLVAFVTRMGDPFCGGVLVTRECIT